MIKTLTLILWIWNPVTDSEHEVVYNTYASDYACQEESERLLKTDSHLSQVLKSEGLVLNATTCD